MSEPSVGYGSASVLGCVRVLVHDVVAGPRHPQQRGAWSCWKVR